MGDTEVRRMGAKADDVELGPYGNGNLPEGIRTRMVPDVNGMTMHVLEAGTAGDPVVLLVHGFPELAYSWRNQILPLAAAGYHVLAPDLRGFGRTTGWDDRYEADLREHGLLSKTRDLLGLLWALGHRSVSAIVGHDLGASYASWGPVLRPDVFRSTVILSGPFTGTFPHPFNTAAGEQVPLPTRVPAVASELAALLRPRQHYMDYNQTRAATADWEHPVQGMHDFFRAYYHVKSGDWAGNAPHQLAGRTADEFAKLPTYYVLDLDKTMSQTVAETMPSSAEVAACTWLIDDDVDVHVTEFGRIGFQGALNASYRMLADPANIAEAMTFSGRTLDVPACFIGGAADWGVYQTPGAAEAMQTGTSCTRLTGFHLVEGAGHWVQQERPDEVNELLLRFLRDHAATD
jgi:pimeloyl-ACP methyl ester carboxylesterase